MENKLNNVKKVVKTVIATKTVKRFKKNKNSKSNQLKNRLCVRNAKITKLSSVIKIRLYVNNA